MTQSHREWGDDSQAEEKKGAQTKGGIQKATHFTLASFSADTEGLSFTNIPSLTTSSALRLTPTNPQVDKRHVQQPTFSKRKHMQEECHRNEGNAQKSSKLFTFGHNKTFKTFTKEDENTDENYLQELTRTKT